MKGRSNRLPTSDPHDDWVNGSWTVDCICGVNFDDGEEMVNCDECGVWVHTRCSRYVKGEKSFACDKCKSKSSRNDSEETEVAQLLVELPTKTIKMNNTYPVNNIPPWRPYKLWTERPIEERVHVQGIPGGDPALFQGFSSIFTSELWKCAGYVPKKFNFRYREFPCWEKNQDVAAKADGETENVVSKGAGVLYSLSKETFVASCSAERVTMTGQVKIGGSDKKASVERKWEGGDVKINTMRDSMKREKLPSTVLLSGKRNREDSEPSKDQSVKKKNRTLKEHDKRDKLRSFKTVVTHSRNARQVEVSDGKAHNDEHEHGKDVGSHEFASTSQMSMGGCIEKSKRRATTDEENLTPRSCEMSGLGYSGHKRVNAEKLGNDASDSAKSEDLQLPSLDKDAMTRNPVRKEGLLLHDSNRNEGVQPETPTNDLPKPKPLIGIIANSVLEVRDTEIPKNVNTVAQLSSSYCESGTKLEAAVDDAKEVVRSYPSDIVANSDCMKDLVEQVQSCHESENFKVNDAGPTTSQSHEHEGRGAGKDLELVGICHFEKDDKITDDACKSEVQFDGPEISVEIAKVPSYSKEAPKGAGDTTHLVVTVPSSPPSQHKMVSVGKSYSSSSTILISKSSLSEVNRTGNYQSPSFIGKEISKSIMDTKKESEGVDPLKVQGKREKPKSTAKASPKSSVNSVAKASQTTRATNGPVLKHYTSVGKDSLRQLSSKSASAESSPHPLGIGEPASSVQTQHTVRGLSKNTASSGQQRGEKAPQSNPQSTSKSTQSTSGHLAASNPPPGLSDEELALLLHQELNSSPRVPRVPRVRHTGSLPQLSSASATSMLIKRTSSSGGKDQHTFSRRKNKDVHKDGSHSSLERDIEARKGDRVPSPDSANTSDALSPVAANPGLLHYVKKNAEQISGPAANSSPSSVYAKRGSPVNNADDDADTNKGPGPPHRTLPGLIAEIMGKGRRMTYEELCNAVLPHWQNLRKHNGERYAYSSHSQAVLDCLRNRTEWAQLVDRGPKTNASRKKRKMDSEAASTESEDGEGRMCKVGEGKSLESNKEEFPKGRRNARKGRRLTLRGKSIKNDRRRKIEVGSDHTGSFSDSGNDSESSDDGSHGSGMCATRSGVSAISDDIGADIS